jgi:hypothetical protein
MIGQVASAAHWEPVRSASQHRRAAPGYDGRCLAIGVHLNDALKKTLWYGCRDDVVDAYRIGQCLVEVFRQKMSETTEGARKTHIRLHSRLCVEWDEMNA